MSPNSLSLEQIAEPTALSHWLIGVEQRLRQAPEDRTFLRLRATLLRGLGDLAAAEQAYSALVGDADTARARTILAGEPASWTDLAGPVPFVRIEGVLDASRQQRLWNFVTDPSAGFLDAGVNRGDGGRVDPMTRKAKILQDARELKTWFLPVVEALVDQRNALPRLGLAPFETGERELQVTRHDDDGFQSTHRDSWPNFPLRRLTYVYYFHRRPRGFQGGDLLLFDQTAAETRSGGLGFTRIIPTDNSLILFPADRLHTVTRVTGSGGPLSSRWTVNGWLNARAAEA